MVRSKAWSEGVLAVVVTGQNILGGGEEKGDINSDGFGAGFGFGRIGVK